MVHGIFTGVVCTEDLCVRAHLFEDSQLRKHDWPSPDRSFCLFLRPLALERLPDPGSPRSSLSYPLSSRRLESLTGTDTPLSRSSSLLLLEGGRDPLLPDDLSPDCRDPLLPRLPRLPPPFCFCFAFAIGSLGAWGVTMACAPAASTCNLLAPPCLGNSHQASSSAILSAGPFGGGTQRWRCLTRRPWPGAVPTQGVTMDRVSIFAVGGRPAGLGGCLLPVLSSAQQTAGSSNESKNAAASSQPPASSRPQLWARNSALNQ
jgi:hypothetical protein